MADPWEGLAEVGPKETRDWMRAWPERAVVLAGVGVKRAASGTDAALKARSGSSAARQLFRLRQVMPVPGLPEGRESGYQYEAYGAVAAAFGRTAARAGAAWSSAAAAPAMRTVRLVGFTSKCLLGGWGVPGRE